MSDRAFTCPSCGKRVVVSGASSSGTCSCCGTTLELPVARPPVSAKGAPPPPAPPAQGEARPASEADSAIAPFESATEARSRVIDEYFSSAGVPRRGDYKAALIVVYVTLAVLLAALVVLLLVL